MLCYKAAGLRPPLALALLPVARLLLHKTTGGLVRVAALRTRPARVARGPQPAHTHTHTRRPVSIEHGLTADLSCLPAGAYVCARACVYLRGAASRMCAASRVCVHACTRVCCIKGEHMYVLGVCLRGAASRSMCANPSYPVAPELFKRLLRGIFLARCPGYSIHP